jgi:hypoxanthine phosphoribosyltransferase
MVRTTTKPATPTVLRRATRTLGSAAFEAACADLMRLVESDYTPALLVGVRTGGLVVAEAMARAAAVAVPVLPLTCRRSTTGLKSRIPGLKALLTALPEPVRDAMRQAEHRLLAVRRPATAAPPVDPGEAAAIGAWLADPAHPAPALLTSRPPMPGPPTLCQPPSRQPTSRQPRSRVPTRRVSPSRVMVVDDAVDSGVTLAAVLRTLRESCPPGTELRTAAITVTRPSPAVEPDYALWRGVLCRFPWSFDATE